MDPRIGNIKWLIACVIANDFQWSDNWDLCSLIIGATFRPFSKVGKFWPSSNDHQSAVPTMFWNSHGNQDQILTISAAKLCCRIVLQTNVRVVSSISTELFLSASFFCVRIVHFAAMIDCSFLIFFSTDLLFLSSCCSSVSHFVSFSKLLVPDSCMTVCLWFLSSFFLSSLILLILWILFVCSVVILVAFLSVNPPSVNSSFFAPPTGSLLHVCFLAKLQNWCWSVCNCSWP